MSAGGAFEDCRFHRELSDADTLEDALTAFAKALKRDVEAYAVICGTIEFSSGRIVTVQTPTATKTITPESLAAYLEKIRKFEVNTPFFFNEGGKDFPDLPIALCCNLPLTAKSMGFFLCFEGGKPFTRQAEAVVKKTIPIATLAIRCKILEAAYTCACAQLENRDLVREQFLGNLTHEIRTPLNAIVGYAGLCREEALPPKIMNNLKMIEESGQLLSEIIGDLLEYSSVCSGKRRLAREPFSLDAMLANLVNQGELRARAKGLDFRFSLKGGGGKILVGDQYLAANVLTKLIDNAIKFTPSGSVELAVEILSDARSDCVVKSTVKDTGIGISPDKLGNIFEPFKQVDGSRTRKYGGSGLGLTIVSELVALAKGAVTVESAVGAGSEFIVTLPFSKPSVPVGARVLVVGHKEAWLDVFMNDLKAFGCEVDAVSTAAEVLSGGLPLGGYLAVFLNEPELGGNPEGLLLKFEKLAANRKKIAIISKSRRKSHKVPNWAVYLNAPFDLKALHGLLVEPGLVRNKPPVHRAGKLLLAGKKILVAEDNEINQALLNELLTQHGALVYLAENGKDAIDLINTTDIDLVLMDIQMPVLDGLSATRKIRELGFDTLPVIGITAESISNVIDEVVSAGMNDCLTKPIAANDIFSSIEKFVSDT